MAAETKEERVELVSFELVTTRVTKSDTSSCLSTSILITHKRIISVTSSKRVDQLLRLIAPTLQDSQPLLDPLQSTLHRPDLLTLVPLASTGVRLPSLEKEGEFSRDPGEGEVPVFGSVGEGLAEEDDLRTGKGEKGWCEWEEREKERGWR